MSKITGIWAKHPVMDRVLRKFPHKTDTTESMTERSIWDNQIEFILTNVSYIVGLSNFYRFAHLTHRSGGGAFLIPYVISLFCLGIPVYFLELCIGQFSNMGPIAIWEVNPLFRGLGYSMVILAAIISVYYNIIISWAIFYTFASMETSLPWATCGNKWNTCNCRTPGMGLNLSDPLLWHGTIGLNCSDLDFSPSDITSASEEYFYRRVLKRSEHLFDIGAIQWELSSCNFLAWILIAFWLIEGGKTMGKIAVVTAILPCILLMAFLIRGLTLQGAKIGTAFYFKIDVSKLQDANVWHSAAGQVFFSMGTSCGSVIALGSYYNFHTNIIRESVALPILDALLSYVAGLIVFSVLGFMSNYHGVPITEVVSSDPGLMFVAYTEALAQMPASHVWSLLFFFMLILSGLGTQISAIETVFTALQDEFEIFRKPECTEMFRPVGCFVMFLLGVPFTTQSGSYLLNLFDDFISYPLLYIAFHEIVAIIWIYGYPRFAEDIRLMMGWSGYTRHLIERYFHYCWVIVTPSLILVISIGAIFNHDSKISSEFSLSAEILGWSVIFAILIWTPVWYIKEFLEKWSTEEFENSNFLEVLQAANQPTEEWGPKLERRTSPRFKPRLQPVSDLPMLVMSESAASARQGLRALETRILSARQIGAFVPKRLSTIREEEPEMGTFL